MKYYLPNESFSRGERATWYRVCDERTPNERRIDRKPPCTCAWAIIPRRPLNPELRSGCNLLLSHIRRAFTQRGHPGHSTAGTAAIETGATRKSFWRMCVCTCIGALSLYTIKPPPRNDPYAIMRVRHVPTYMNINTAFSAAFPKAAARGGSPRGDRTGRARARGKEGLREAERSESHANRERRRSTREGEGNRDGATREREKEREGDSRRRIKESVSEWVKVSWNTEAVLWNWSAACIISDSLYSLRRSVLHGCPPGRRVDMRLNQ